MSNFRDVGLASAALSPAMPAVQGVCLKNPKLESRVANPLNLFPNSL